MPTEIEKITTGVALGSIFCFGIFLILDVWNRSFFMQFEGYVSTTSFGVIAAIPTLAFLYIVGALISLVSDIVFQILSPKGYNREWELLALVIKKNNEFFSNTFFELLRKKKILEGSVLPVFTLGIGVGLESQNLTSLKIPLILSGVILIVLAIVLPLFTDRVQKNMERITKMVYEQDDAKE